MREETPKTNDEREMREAIGGYGRRGFMRTALLGAGVLAIGSRVEGAEVDCRLPLVWRLRQGAGLKGYTHYLESLKLKRIGVTQVLEAHAKCRSGTWNDLPPKTLWKNMGTTLQALDLVAAELDQPVREIVSAYRSARYNAKCPGAARGSWHLRNNALDVQFGASPATVAAAAKQLRTKGKFSGGVGRYASFTHIDTRGVNATW